VGDPPVPERPGRRQNLAAGLARHEQLRAAVAAGGANLAQAAVVVAVLAALPGDLAPEFRARAEEVMVGHCAEFGPRELTRLGSRLLDVLARRSPTPWKRGACASRRPEHEPPHGCS
jgi:hypothetical protein